MLPVIDLTVASYAMAMIVVYYAGLFCVGLRRRPRLAAGGFAPGVVFLVPARDEAAVLEATIERLLAQDYAGPIRALIVDDGSQDATATVASRATRSDRRVRVLRRDESVAGTGKSAVLNEGYAYIGRALVTNDPWLGDAAGPDLCICVVDADGHLSNDATRHAVELLADPSVAAVQVAVHIRNAQASFLARLQDLEFVGFSYMVQVARDAFGSVGLGGNGQYSRFSALASLGDAPWRAGSLTEDLDLGLRLQLAGWRLRFCPAASVAQEGLTRLRPLLRQRTRWTQGHYQCWRYLPRLVTQRGLALRQRLDTLAYLLFVALVVLVATTQVIDLLGALQVVVPTDSFLSFLGDGIAFRTVELVISWLPVLLVLITYQRAAHQPLRCWEVPAFAAYFAVYVYTWAVATTRAWCRLALGRGAWTKTPRLAADTPFVSDIQPGTGTP